MPASTESRAALLMLLLAGTGAQAQFAGRLLEAVDSNDAGRNVTVFAQLRCSARYLSHSPRDSGDEVRVRLKLGTDCGDVAPAADEVAASGGGSALLRTVRLTYLLPGEVEVSFSWHGVHRFVVAPTTDAHGIRVRILDAHPAPRTGVSVAPLDEATRGYAVNLASSTTVFPQTEIDAAAAILNTPVHVSRIELAGQTWHRLRAGPVSARRDAERLLAVARRNYPRAWLGVDDEPAAAEVIVPQGDTLASITEVDAALSDAARDQLMKDARRAISARESARAIELLTLLTRQPEHPARARAQEMLGLTRERAGQVAHAKAEYEEYLRRYPRGEAAPRVRSRLRALASASRAAHGGALAGGADRESSWRLDGGAAVSYRWQRSDLTTSGASTGQQDQNAVYTDADLITRRRGERFDLVSRLSAGHAHDLLPDGPGDRARVSAAFVELNDRELGVAARLGRQSRNSGGLLGTFDGLYASYQWRESIAFTAATGLAVESTRDAPDTDRRFVGLSAEFGPFEDRFDFGAFAVQQQLDGITDRQAVGLEARYFVPGRTLLAVVDYDLHYQELNSALITGSLQLPARWALSFSADHRRAPVLTTRNALIGQPFATLDELLTLFSPAEVEMLARDRTPLSDLLSVSLSRPLGERFQVSLEGYGTRIDETVASGNVAATPATGMERTAQLQFTGSSLATANDLWLLALRSQNGAQARIDSLLLAARLPLGHAWRLGPRLRVDRRHSAIDDAKQTLYVPTIRLDYLRGRSWLECELGAERGSRQLETDREDSQRLYFGLSWRVNF